MEINVIQLKMKQNVIQIDSFSDDRNYQSSGFYLQTPRNKKYLLHKMMTNDQKQFLKNKKNRTQKRDPQYFAKMLKQQKKNMFVSTFIKKLKNSVILQTPPMNYTFHSQQNQQQQYEAIQFPKQVQMAISVFLFIQTIPLLLLNSLALIFTQVEQSPILTIYNSLSLVVHLLEIFKRIFILNNCQDKKVKSFKDKLQNYMYSQDFIIDLLVFLGFITSLCFTGYNSQYQTILIISRIFIFLKINAIIYLLSYIQLTLFENQYRAEIWSLIKVFLFNFVIAHFLTILLVSMTNLNPNHNWIIVRGLQDSNWLEVYIWGYYWATTIMLTVGFGDIVPTNKNQALCMVFIQTMSCIVLAYNINRVGSIISKIRSYDEQKNQSMKVFNQISQKTEISPEVQAKITNYIKESSVIKRNYNIEQQKKFITKLPTSFKDELLKDMNKRIWYGMTFFQNLTQKSVLQLSKFLQKKLTHPDEIVYSRGQQVEIMIFNSGSFGLAYNYGQSRSNGKFIETYNIKPHQYRIASLGFLFNQKMNYDIKCIDYAIYYKVKARSMLLILENHPYDYQYYFMVKDKDKFLLNQFQIQKCAICLNQRHTSFKCPRLHYIPIKQHVIQREWKNFKLKNLRFVRKNLSARQKLSQLKCLKNRKKIQHQLQKKRIQLNENVAQSLTVISQDSDLKFIAEETSQSGQKSLGLSMFLQQKTMLDGAFDKFKENLYGPTINDYVWDIQCDLAHNFNFYFKNSNAEEFGKKNSKKGKSKKLVYDQTN